MHNPYVQFVITEFFDRLSAAVREAADTDPGLRSTLEELDGRKIILKFTDLDRQLGICVEEGSIIESEVTDDEADIVIEGTLSAVTKLAFSKSKNPNRIEGVEIHGDMKLAQRLIRMFESVEIDWEEILANRIGDVPARQVGNMVRWGRRNLFGDDSPLSDRVRNLLTDQKQHLPKRSRVDQFQDDVDTLQADLDRLDRRMDRLDRDSKR